MKISKVIYLICYCFMLISSVFLLIDFIINKRYLSLIAIPLILYIALPELIKIIRKDGY